MGPVTEQLIDNIYEAAFQPDRWPSVLEALAQATGGVGGLLFAAQEKGLHWTASERVHQAFHDYVVDGWFRRCGRRICLFDTAHSSFLTEKDYWTEEEYSNNEIYQKFFIPRSLGWSAGTGLTITTGDNIVCSIENDYSTGPMDDKNKFYLNSLRPHIARSAMVAARLGLESATTAAETMAKIGVPIFLLNRSGDIIKAHHTTEALSSSVTYKNGQLGFLNNKAHQLYTNALATAYNPQGKSPSSFPVSDQEDTAQFVAHLLPLRGASQDIFRHGYAILILLSLNTTPIPPTMIIRSLFDLTHAEAQTARALVKGNTVQQIAALQGVSVNTIRTHLRKVMEKTGCIRQAELVSMLSNISLER